MTRGLDRSLVRLCLFVAACTFGANRSAFACINGGTDADIQAALDSTNVASLCPGTEFTITRPIHLAANAEIYTEGADTGATRALLRVANAVSSYDPAIWAYANVFAIVDGQFNENVKIRWIRVDGNRANNPDGYTVYDNVAGMGFGEHHWHVLIRLGGSGSILDHVEALHTLGFAAVAAGSSICTGLQITSNYIADNGTYHWPGQGEVPLFADGLDVQCSGSEIAYNEVRNATDGAISFYGGTGTSIHDNFVANSGTSAISGIIAGPATLGTPDMTNSEIHHNLINTDSLGVYHFNVALAAGFHLWCNDSNDTNGSCLPGSGIRITDNQGTGTYGYGIYLGGMWNATVSGNNLVMTPWTPQGSGRWGYYVLDGDTSAGYFWPHATPDPASGGFQPGFEKRLGLHWPCLGPLDGAPIGCTGSVWPGPYLNQIQPASGPVGTSVTFTGVDFGQSVGGVEFNGVTVTPTSWSSTSVVATVPAGATTGNVNVVANGMVSNPLTFTVTTSQPTSPTLTTVSPSGGPIGTWVTITGTNFGASQGTSTVRFNGTTATPTSWSATSLVAPVPSGATTGNVVVTVNSVASNGVSFTVTVPPSITSLSPTSGPVGTSVTITGANFGATQGTSTVKFNGITATPTSWSATSLVAPVPSGATTGNVVVTVNSVASNGVSFTVTVPPSITSLAPTSGPVGIAVTITGTNFGATQGTSTVKFNGTTATPTSWSATSLVVAVPAGATTGNVVVTVGGLASNSLSFTVTTTSAPTLTSLAPTSGPVGTAVTITGTNFGATQGTSTVKFNGTTATPTSWSATSLVVPVPVGATTGNVVVTVNNLASNALPFTVTTAATITYIQGAYAVPQTPQTTVTVPYAGAQTAGDFNVVVIGWMDATSHVATVSDTVGNLYVAALPPTVQPGVQSLVIYYAANIAAATTNVVTVTFDAAAPYPDVRIAQYRGIDPATPVDIAGGASGTGTLSSSGTLTTTNPNDLLLGANNLQAHTTGPGAGYTQRLLTSPDGNILEDRVVTATGSYSATASTSGAGWVMQLVAFRAAGGGPVAPTLTSLAPTSGPVGTAVTITGTNFGVTQGTSTVKFNGTTATPTSWSATSLVVPVPAGATTGNVVVTVGGLASNSLPFTVTTTSAPTLTSLAPTSGPVGTAVTITGTNFGASQGTSTVTFNGTAATPTSWSATSLVVPVPVGATTGNVVVTVNNLASNALPFTVTTAATITYIQGAYAVPQTPQTTVTVPYAGAQTAGDFNVVVIGWMDATSHVATVSDTVGNLYVAALPPTVQPGVQSLVIYYAANIAAATTNVVTVTFDAAAPYPDVRIAQYRGIDPATPVDIAGGASGTGTLSSSGTLTTTNPNDLLLGANNLQAHTTGPGAGYTQRLLTSPDGNILEDRVVTATGSYSATASTSGAGWVMQLVAFRAAGGGPVAPTLTSLAPTSGPVGTAVTITGTNFGVTQGTSTVKFNGTTATPTSWSATSLVVPVPVGATTGNVVVTVGGLASNALPFTVTTAATITYIQGAYAVPQTPQTTVTVPYAGAQTAGDFNVVVIGWMDATSHVATVSDTVGNLYVAALPPTVQPGVQSLVIYYAANIAAATTNVVTVTFDAAAPYPDVRIAQYRGIDPATPVDIAGGASGTGTLSSSGTLTTTNPNDLLLGANNLQAHTTGPGAGYTQRLLTSPDGNILEDRVVTATGSYSATAPTSGAGWVMQLVAFRAAGGGP